MTHTYGYMRVSSRDQNAQRQQVAMHAYGIRDEYLFLDKQSGKDFHRPQYKTMVAMLRPGDTVVIKSIDRLGRNYQEILTQWRDLTQERGVGLVVLDMPLLNTRQTRDLTGTLIADIVLQLLSYVAQTEREFIRARQAEGIAAAKEKGVRFGRKPMERPRELAPLLALWKQGQLSARGAARKLGVTHNTFLKWAAQDGE